MGFPFSPSNSLRRKTESFSAFRHIYTCPAVGTESGTMPLKSKFQHRPQKNQNNNCPKKEPPDAPNRHMIRRTRMAPAWPRMMPRWAKMGQEKTWTKKGSGRTLKIRAWYWGKANKKRGESRKTLKILAWYWENANKKKGKWRLRWPKTTPRWQRRAQRPKMATEP